MDRRLVALVVLAVSMALPACGPETPAAWDGPRSIQGPIRGGGTMAYLDTGRELLHVLEPTTGGTPVGLNRAELQTGPDPLQMAAEEDASPIFVLNGDRTLDIFQFSGGGFRDTELGLEHAYTRLRLSPTEAFGVLDGSGAGALGILDLRDGIPSEVHRFSSIESAEWMAFARRPGSDDGSSPLVAVATNNRLVLIDLAAVADGADEAVVRETPLPAAGSEPADAALVVLPEAGPQVLFLDSRESSLHLAGFESDESRRYSLPTDGSASGLLVEPSNSPRVLAWSETSSTVAVVRPAALADASNGEPPENAITAVDLDERPASLRLDLSLGYPRAIALHGPPNGGFSLLHLQRAGIEVRHLASAPLADLRLHGSTAYGLPADIPNAGYFQTAEGESSTFPIPSPGDHLMYDRNDQLLLSDHGHPEGEFTVVDVGEDVPQDPPSRTKVFEGVFTRDLFQSDFASH